MEEIVTTSTSNQRIELNVKGMTCTNCALGIEQYLKQEGLQAVSVDFSHDEVNFELVEGRELPRIIKGIEKLGFEVVNEEEGGGSTGMSKVEKLFYLCLLFTLPLLLHMFVAWAPLHNPWVQLVLATPVYLMGMWHFGNSALRSIRNGVPNMDVLITLGASAAFFYSLYGTLMAKGPDFLFYETAASILTLVLLGNVLEHRAVQKTTSAVKALSSLQKPLAKRLISQEDDAPFEHVSADKLVQGDHILLNQGDRIPVDGHVLQGAGAADESMISGESEAVEKSRGDRVIGGTLLVSGNLRMQATEVGSETVLSQIIELVKKAQADKPSIQKFADRISAIFVPVVLVIALLTFLISYFWVGIGMENALIHSVAVLVIACPCAMGLATPTAVVVGIGRASQNGILIKGGRTLEQFSSIQRVVFDKTGTLTSGAFSIKEFQAYQGEEAAIKATLLSMELRSNHPIAKSLVKWLKAEGHEPAALERIEEQDGRGLEAWDEAGNHYQLGSSRWLKVQDAPEHDLYLLQNGELLAGMALKDELREGAREALQFLHDQGIETVLLSGDKREKCEQVARELGIQTVLAECLPDEKLRHIERLSAENPTAMVGDGINDAPALARASLGISLGKATDVAMQSAQIILLNERLDAIIALFQVGKHTVMTIKQNLFWALFYNVLAIPLAAVGLLSPIIGAATMAMSDVVVIGNSLRLKVKKLSKA